MSIERQHVHVSGVVQGVGFRPFVYGLAHRWDLDGWVYNSSDGVDIEIQGERATLAQFIIALQEEAPPLAHIEEITVAGVSPVAEHGFVIRNSVTRPGASLISPDVATCPDCLREVFNPADRRYRYPFTNCTNCGPRFTIIEGLPYDRPKTTMSEFPMCPQCLAEYENPLDRRFHAQPNACPVCGPHVWMVSSSGSEAAGSSSRYSDTLAHTEDPFKAAASLLRLGGTMGIKGLGGFHLACDATNDEAVRWLRRRKGRQAKPFAVMMKDMDMVRRYCEVSPEEEGLLRSVSAPIVLLWRKPGTDLALTVAPRNRTVGVMLPYTPLHHILLRQAGRPLVMTSGNHTDEPLAQNNEDALHELGDIADAFLLHNRRIHVRCDDSVWMVPALPGGERRPLPVRRSRGYAPFPIKVHFRTPIPVFAAGAQMKNTFCVLKEDQAFLSQHIGELDNLETLAFYEAAISHIEQIFEAPAEIVAHDMHPDYLSTRYAVDRGGRLHPVQHHHAHIASCMADNQVDGPVIGVALDGTGYGPDGCVWGGEFLLADYSHYERVAHLEYLPLPGGEAAIRRPYRLALAYLHTLCGDVPDLPFIESIDPQERRIVVQQVEKGINTPLTSSCGRLFDAVSALLDVRGEITYEAQAAIELEMLATPGPQGDERDLGHWLERPYPYRIDREQDGRILRIGDLLAAIVEDVQAQVPAARVSQRFHATLAVITANMCDQIRREHHVDRVALSGGCYQNQLLLRLTLIALRNKNVDVLIHRRVPPNDGGISLGQAAVAAHQLSVPA
jgi:hydrogenase maturation protein HypF